MHTPRTTTIAVLIAAATAASGLITIVPAQARPALPAAPASTCTRGVPLRGDYNGDGHADPAVQAWRTGSSPATTSFQVRLTSDTGTWLDGAHTLRPADLNGDTCADAVVTYNEPTSMVKLFLGSPDGLQDSGTTIVPPQVTSGDHSQINAIVLKHDRLVQIVVVGQAAHAFIDVYTLNKAGVPGKPQIIAGTALKHAWAGSTSNAFGTKLAGSGRTVVIGSPDERGAKHTYQGAVYLLRSSAKHPAKLVLRQRITQSSRGVYGAPGQGHQFGSAVAYRSGVVAIGIKGQSAGTGKRGAVELLSWPDSSSRTYRAGRVFLRGGAANTDGLFWQFGEQVTLARGLTASKSTDLVISGHDGSLGASVVVANTRTSRRAVLTSATAFLPQRSWFSEGYVVIGVIRSTAIQDQLLLKVSDDSRPSCGPDSAYASVTSPGVIGSGSSWTRLPAPDCSAGYSAWGSSFE